MRSLRANASESLHKIAYTAQAVTSVSTTNLSTAKLTNHLRRPLLLTHYFSTQKDYTSKIKHRTPTTLNS